MITAYVFYFVLLTVPIVGSGILGLVYFCYLPGHSRDKILWAPVIVGFLTTIIFFFFHVQLYILGYVCWIALAVSFWYGWKKAAKRLIKSEGFSLETIGISERSTTDADGRGAKAYGVGGTSRGFALIGLIFVYPFLAAVLNVYLALKLRESVNRS